MPSHKKLKKDQSGRSNPEGPENQGKSQTDFNSSSVEGIYSSADRGKYEKRAWLLRKSFRLNEDVDDELFEFLETLTYSSWETYHVSPLYAFEGTEVRLKQYGLKLLTYLANTELNERSDDVRYDARFKCVSDFNGNEENKIVKIQVQKSGEEDVKETIYLGFIISWNGPQLNMVNLGEFLYLPVLLCRGKMKVKELVHSALQKFFDCLITPYHLLHIDLVWITGLFISLSKCKETDNRPVKFTFHPSWEAETTHQWELLLSLSEIKKIWNKIHPGRNKVITMKEVRIFYNGLIKTISVTSGIKFGMYRISCIKFPDITVRASGQFLCKSTVILDNLLLYLCSGETCPDVTKSTPEESVSLV